MFARQRKDGACGMLGRSWNPTRKFSTLRSGLALPLLFSSLLLSNLELSDTKVYAPEIRPRLGTAAHFCEVVVLKLPHLFEMMSSHVLSLPRSSWLIVFTPNVDNF